ncbi:MAG: Na+/H+ antiporter NhaA [Calditrichaeota bacterium]|nr:Na+/H+ antiporter NhaA [Calditrichota bacterium]
MDSRSPSSQFDRARAWLVEFLRLESAGGLVLMGATVLAMIVANSPLRPVSSRLLDLEFSIKLAGWGVAKPVQLWINDGLMAIFFFLVGLELKRELAEGHLASLRRATLPAVAATGGMLLPAIFYSALNWGDSTAMRGWAIPTATDIAFALGVLSLLGKRVPTALKAFLLSVAIFDDLGAVLVIALFYTAKISATALLVAGIFVLGLALLNRLGVTRVFPYVLLGVPLWVAVLKSGVHATLAGVVVAAFIPLRTRTGHSPLKHLEHTLHPWVAFGVLPIFALANAGVSLSGLSISDLLHPVPLGIVTGLFFGKQVGILAFSALAVRIGIASLPADTNWRQLYGVALLCGIGFTMSLFIASLAFEQGGPAYSGLERLGILLGSLASGIAGYAVLRLVIRVEKS